MKKQFIKICPKCGSINIEFGVAFDAPKLWGIVGANPIMNNFCKDCEYGKFDNNSIFPEIKKSEIDIFRKKLEENK